MRSGYLVLKNFAYSEVVLTEEYAHRKHRLLYSAKPIGKAIKPDSKGLRVFAAYWVDNALTLHCMKSFWSWVRS